MAQHTIGLCMTGTWRTSLYVIPSGEKLKSLPVNQPEDMDVYHYSVLEYSVLDLSQIKIQEKEMKGIHTGKEVQLSLFVDGMIFNIEKLKIFYQKT